jgi:SAM-dependent methyltransferase
MADRLTAVLRRFDLAADIGTPAGAVRSALAASAEGAGGAGAARGAIGTIIAVDPLLGTAPSRDLGAPNSPSSLGNGGEAAPALGVAADEEALPFADGSLDLVVSGLALQAVNDLPGALVQIKRALRPDGLFLAALLGGDTLCELRQSFAAAESDLEGGASPRVAPFPDLRDMGALLQRAGFALPVVDSDRITARYFSPFNLLRDLRRMGAANPLVERRRAPLRRSTLARAMEVYASRFADPDGKVRATFEIIWLSGWSPHESQQHPLRPGSAKARLAGALGAAAYSAGDNSGP